MRRIGVAAGLAALVLAGCTDESVAPFPAPMEAASADMRLAEADTEADGAGADESADLLAYSYDTTLRLPGGAVRDLLAAHRDRCQAAGARVCQVLLAESRGQDARVYGTLQFRAAPPYVASFRAGLGEATEAAGGSILSDSQSIENLTRAILDARARIEAQETLRDRLLDLLDRTDGEIGDLLAAERELARVHGEIESMLSQLRALEGRVAMNTVTLAYEPQPEALARGSGRRLGDAVRGFFGVLIDSLAGLVWFVAAALPWVVIGVPTLWLGVRFLRRLLRRRRTA